MNEKYNNIGKRIEDILYLKRMTQTELADKLGIRLQTLSVWIRGKRNPKLNTIEKIANALDVPVKELTEIKDVSNNKNKAEKKYISKDIQLKLKELEIKFLTLEKNIEERFLKLENEILKNK